MPVAAAEPTAMRRPDRRAVDRRRSATPMFSRYTFAGGRRAGDRRDPGSPDQYVDLYPPRIAAALVAIGVLCALDAIFTLLHLQKDGREANPIMALLIDAAGPRWFLIVKCAITDLGLIVLCLHKNFRYVNAVIVALLGVYGALFAYHIYLAATFH